MHWLWLLLFAIAVAVVAAGFYLCLPYWRSPQKRWRDAVVQARRAASRQVAAATTELKHLAERCRAEAQSLTQDGFNQFLASISVQELDAYPGIGPATVARLQKAGYGNLHRLCTARIHVAGLGNKRLNDVTSATRQLTREAQSRFQAGACQQAQDLAGKLRELQATYADREHQARARCDAATALIGDLEDRVELARQVTLWKHFWDVQVSVPPQWLQQPMPGPFAAPRIVQQQPHNEFRVQQTPAGSRLVQPVLPAATPPAENGVRVPATAVQNGAPPRVLLEIDPSVPLTEDLIRRQYVLLSERLAPQKVQGLGAEFVAMAESKCAALRAAAEALLRPFGKPLDVPAHEALQPELRPNPDLDEMFGA